MDLDARLQLSYYETVTEINGEHQITLVRHRENGRFYVKKVLSIYHPDVYRQLMESPIQGLPKIQCLYEENNRLTVIEEFISGINLEDLLAEKGAIPLDTVIRYSLELCHILSALHALRPPIIHRDIKPENLVLTPDGHIILLDLDASRPGISKEKDTNLLGTKGYAAPEQYGFGSSDEKTDVYALGILMNTFLWGHFEQRVFPHGPLKRIIDKCTRIDPKKRYRNMNALINALEPLAVPNNFRNFPPSKSRFLPPGFRSGNFTHALVAIIGYIFIFDYALTLRITGVEGGLKVFSRIFTLISFLFLILILCDYCGLKRRIMPLSVSKKLGLRILGDIILTVVFPIAFYVIMVAVVTFISVFFLQ